MQNNITELVLIIDRSGSMAGLESDTIGGINAVLEKNRALEGETIVSTVLFDHQTKVLHDRKDIRDVRPLTTDDYQVRGSTALLDAVGGSIGFIERVQKYLPESYRPSKTIFVITTDGMENSSLKYTYDRVKALIDRKQKEGWEFLFLGANIDVAAESQRMGIAVDRFASYEAAPGAQREMYDVVAQTTCKMRHESARIDGSWRDAFKRKR